MKYIRPYRVMHGLEIRPLVGEPGAALKRTVPIVTMRIDEPGAAPKFIDADGRDFLDFDSAGSGERYPAIVYCDGEVFDGAELLGSVTEFIRRLRVAYPGKFDRIE